MKKIINTIKYGLLSFLFLFNFSCNEQEFLEEIPLDFFSPENSFQSNEDFQRALTDLYARVREILYTQAPNADARLNSYLVGTDIALNARRDSRWFGDYNVLLDPTHYNVEYHWNKWYKIVSNANTIISRLENSQLTNDQAKLVSAEAKFFRAYAYRYLVYLYGGVPLITEEITAPKTDFIRASREEVLNQIIKDLSEAAQNLPPIYEVMDGKVSNIVASHYLAETYISLDKYDEAIAEATKVIDDPNTNLMTSRFGSKMNEDPYDPYLKFTQPGDIYWDLFQQNNQNRNSGNKEALWVAQFELDVPGGALSSSGGYGGVNVLERAAGPVAHLTFKDPDGNEGSIGSQSTYNSGGRGISNLRNTDYYLYTIWESDWDNDIRNSPHNIVRDFIYSNPNSPYFGKSAIYDYPSPTWLSQDWRWYPYPSKITTPGDHPDDLFKDKDNLLLKTSAGQTYRDEYILRLAETFLLRAEAYLLKGDLQNAANDINKVRERSNAKPVGPAEVTLDYILDERARELIYEEQRRITLHRTGTLVERVRKYNDLNTDNIQDHHGLWPIPFAEIEANKDAVIEQNPGYN